MYCICGRDIYARLKKYKHFFKFIIFDYVERLVIHYNLANFSFPKSLLIKLKKIYINKNFNIIEDLKYQTYIFLSIRSYIFIHFLLLSFFMFNNFRMNFIYMTPKC